jgi:hypothetical protein
VGEINFVELAKSYIENNTGLQVDKQKGNWLKIHDLNIRIYVNGSKLYPPNPNLPTYGWYDLSENTYDEILNDQLNKCFNLIILGDTNITFLIPHSEFLKIFDKKFMTKPKEWMFHIFKEDKSYILKFTNGSNQSEITNFLNNLDPIQNEVVNKKHIMNSFEPKNEHDISYKKEPLVFVTGYDEKNLNHSIIHKTLGWRNLSSILSKGDYVFVYNKNSHMIQTAFMVIDKSIDQKPIWEEENISDTHEIEFPYRWDAEVIRDDLQINLDVINSFEPFNGNAVQKFIPLVGNNFPTVLSNEKYTKFRNFLLQSLKKSEQDTSEKFQKSYWKIAPGEHASQWEEQLKNGVIAIGWNEIGDLSNRSIDDISDRIRKLWSESSNAIIPQFEDFLAIREGDIIIANMGISKIVGIGEIVGKYVYRTDLPFSHTYPVKWFDTRERNISPQKGIWRKT